MSERQSPRRVPGVARIRWGVVAPVGLFLLAIAAVLWLNFTAEGEAEPPPLLGAIGTPIRGTFIPSTATPLGARATPRPRPTFAGVLRGTPEERDQRRRSDLLIVLDALNRYRDREGDYPFTNNNIQTLCAFKEVDAGCVLREILGADPPEDPAGQPVENGYWYQSDGERVRLYASLELEIPDEERCDTDYVEFEDKPSMICVTFPAPPPR